MKTDRRIVFHGTSSEFLRQYKTIRPLWVLLCLREENKVTLGSLEIAKHMGSILVTQRKEV